MIEIIKHLAHWLRPIKIIGEGNVLIGVKNKIKGGNLLRINGKNNVVRISDSVKIGTLNIIISGDNNTLIIEPEARLIGPCVIEMHGNATITIGRNAGVRGVHFLAKDGKITVGDLVMFSYGINIRNTDSHRIFSCASPDVVTNPSADIEIGRHAWICMNASILKGVKVGSDSVVGYGAVLTRDCPANAVVAGNPARVVKTGIIWDY